MARFEEVAANLGVDSAKLGDEWMMIPLGGHNLVRLTDGDGYSVAESGKKGLTINEVTKEFTAAARQDLGLLGALLMANSRVFRVSSRTPGEAKIVARKGGLTTELKVSAHPRRTDFKVAFYFLQDRNAHGAVTPRTAFNPSMASAWIRDLNRVFGPQANIWFELRRSEFLPVAGLADEVGSESDLSKLAATRKASGVPISVFLAGPKVRPLDGHHSLGFFHHATKVIVVQDQFVSDPWAGLSAPTLKTIAHEIGHFMNDSRGGGGEGHYFFEKNGYLSDILNTLDGGNIKISRQRVVHWNPW